MNAKPTCECYDRLPAGSTYQEVGVDETEGRYGDVSVTTCSVCGRRWLSYFVEYEAFTASQRWIRGVLPASQMVPPPKNAVPIFNTMPWYFYRFSQRKRQIGKGNAPAGLTFNGGVAVEIDFEAEKLNGIPSSAQPKSRGGASCKNLGPTLSTHPPNPVKSFIKPS